MLCFIGRLEESTDCDNTEEAVTWNTKRPRGRFSTIQHVQTKWFEHRRLCTEIALNQHKCQWVDSTSHSKRTYESEKHVDTFALRTEKTEIMNWHEMRFTWIECWSILNSVPPHVLRLYAEQTKKLQFFCVINVLRELQYTIFEKKTSFVPSFWSTQMNC